MNKNSLSGKLFLVPRTHAPKHAEISNRHLPKLTNDALIPLALVFLAIVALAGYVCLYGDWDRARDFLCIFLPPITALMGTASTDRRRS